jgi:hypothetical protein
LANTCGSDGEHSDNGAEEVELEIRDRRDADSQEQDH